MGKAERDALVSTLSPGHRSLRELSGPPPLTGEGHQVVPVELPGRLRDWSAEHGFSMATVVRGLVATLLEGQDGTVRWTNSAMSGTTSRSKSCG